MFVDQVTIRVEAGKGGDGCMSFRREKYVPRGGPDGGDGGNGGSIIVRAVVGVDNLAPIAHRKHWKAKSGINGQGSNRHGRNADDVFIDVPPGTVVRDADGDYVLKDLVADGDTVIAARGGRGGKGNMRFKSATNQAPRQFTGGGKPEVRQLALELKVIADVGLIGMPNAGKSTLLARLSRARPQIADYPFTTKTPNLGRIQVTLDRHCILADIPGLIEGAHDGVGLGHEFLRHIERTRVLVHLVEPQPIDESDPIHNYQVINEELAEYSEDLKTRPQIIAVSKAELPGSADVRQRLADVLGRPTLAISAVTGQGLDILQQTILSTLDQIADGDE
jgi:GTP-binding protein